MRKKNLKPILSSRNCSGFSLMELLLAVTILSIVLSMAYSILISTLQARDRIHSITDADRAASRLIAIITRDIEATYLYQLEGNFFSGKNSKDETRLDFITNTDSLFFSNDLRSDLCEVSYFVRPNPQESGTLQLLRREDFFLDGDPTKGGYAIRLFDRLTDFQLTFYDDKNVPAKSWNAKDKGGLPAAVELSLRIPLLPSGTPWELLWQNSRTFHVYIPILVSATAPPAPKKKENENEH